jgi:hypothetical protein
MRAQRAISWHLENVAAHRDSALGANPLRFRKDDENRMSGDN